MSASRAEMAPGLVERLRRLDTSAVSDAMDAARLHGVVTGIVPIWSSGPLAGRVVPVKLVRADGVPPPSRHLGTTAIEAGGPDDVIVVDNRGRLEMGGWGGLLASIAGVVVDGACRDADEIAEIGFTVFARATTPRTARGRVVEQPADEIEIGGVRVRRGYYVLADKTAIVFLPAEKTEVVVTSAEAIVAREAVMATALARGLPAASVMGLAYEELLSRIAPDGK